MKFKIFVTCFLGAMFGANLWLTVQRYRLEQLKKLATSQTYGDAVRAASRHVDGHQDMIHRPPDGNCPEGYDLEPKAFSRHGEFWDGCRKRGSNPNGGTIDFILGQESVGRGQSQGAKA